jgi:integrase
MPARRKVLTELQVAKLPRKAKRYHMADPTQQGLVLRVPPSGPICYSAVAWRGGKQSWQALGTTATISLDEARALAREACRKIKTGLPRAVTALPSVAAVADSWVALKVEAEGYRTGFERKRVIEKYLKPHLGHIPLADLRRSHVTAMMDALADRHGKPMADQVLKALSAICRWHEVRSDDFRSPVTRGMRRSSAASRERILSDPEIRIVWELAGKSGAYGDFLKVALLTGQRRGKLQAMTWDQIEDGIWRIARLAREKQTAGDLRLPEMALEIIFRQPRLVGDSRVFRRPNDRTIARFQDATTLPHWQIHDLRRTARSLLSRAGVQTEIGELVLGHSIKGIQKVYDRHSYFEEKGQALAKLTALIERILNPASNVVALGAAS